MTEADESHSELPKTQTSAGKVMVSAFSVANWNFFIDYLEKGKNINGEYYIIRSTEWRNKEKTGSNVKEKCVVSPRQWTVSQVDENDGQIERIAFQIVLSPTI